LPNGKVAKSLSKPEDLPAWFVSCSLRVKGEKILGNPKFFGFSIRGYHLSNPKTIKK